MSDPVPKPLSPGTRLGKYQILRLLAVGGMADVYLARATGIEGFEKVVVLKRILPQLAVEPELVQMFLDEARLAASLSHPNVVSVYDVGKNDDSYFFTMEYLHGEDLGGVLRAAAKKRRGLSLGHALHIVASVATGLHYAHDKKGRDGTPLGTVHRDVSPSNVMLTFEGSVKIVDFGVARAAIRKTRTQSGETKGKIPYMSPEQARGEDIDRRSDVFALGILLFELTTGTRLFREKNDYAILNRLLNEDAPLASSRRADYPPELEKIVAKALSREREQRHATALELARELEDFAREHKLTASPASLGAYLRELFGERADESKLLAELAVPEPTDATPAPKSSRRRTAWGIAIGVTAALLLGAIGLSRKSAPVQPQVSSSVAPIRSVPPLPSAAASVATAAPPPSTAPAPSATQKRAPQRRQPSRPATSASSKPEKPVKDPAWNLDSPLPP